MRRAALVLVIGLAGCDSLFNLDHVSPTGGGASDAASDGLVADDVLLPCGPFAFDEDSDGRLDGCDACPTVASGSELDTDMDGLPDACDPNLGTMDALGHNLDKIALAVMFSAADDLVNNFTYTNVDNSNGTSFIVVHGDGVDPGSLVTNLLFSPTKIEINVAGISADSYAKQIKLVEPQLTGIIHGSGCDMANVNKTCFSTTPGSGNGELQVAPSAIQKIELFRRVGASMTTLRLTGGLSDSVQSTGPLSQSTFQITTTVDASIQIKSIVFYGSGP